MVTLMTPSRKTFTKDELERAISNNELVLFYQPEFNLEESVFEGVEALVRWNHPEGLLQPAQFLPEIESEGLLLKMGDWVLEEACRQSKVWKEKGLPPLRMAINIYTEQFQQANFVDNVLSMLAKYQVDPGTFELELTENMIIHVDDLAAHENIRRLRARGVMIALDDFGTGFSSISHLKRIRVDRIKIDRSYIQYIHMNTDDAAIVKAIIALANGLSLRSLAEGVETHHQLQVLLKYDCQEVQGFYFSDPLSAQETEEFLKKYQKNPFIFRRR